MVVDIVQQYVCLDCESHSEIFLAKSIYHFKMNHIDVQYHFDRAMVEYKKVLLDNFDTLKNIAD